MEYHFPVFIYAYVVAGVLSIISAISVSWRRTSQGSLPFTYLMLALSAWSIFTIFEAGATQVSGKLFWSKWQYLGIISVPPLWVYFVADFTNKEQFKRYRFRHLIWVIPLITLALALTNEFHGLIWTDIHIPIESKNFIAIYDHCFWFYLNTLHSYTFLLLGSIWIIQQILAFPKKRRTQSLIIFLVMAVSWASNIIYILGIFPVPGLDITPLSFTLIALVLSWLIYRKQLFDVIPIARSRLVDNMSDGLIIIDPDDIIIDINPAALSIAKYDGPDPVGMLISEAFSGCCKEIISLGNEEKVHKEMEMDSGRKHLDIKVDPISGEGTENSGKIIIIRDITDQRRIELVEEEQRKLAQALADTAAAINSSLELDEVLDQILEIVGNVVPHETASIALLNENGWIQFVKAKGYEKFNDSEKILSFEGRLEDIPNMREMAKTLQPSLNMDTEDDPDWVKIPGSEWIRSYIGAPIHFKGKVLGFINLDSSKPNFFKQEHLPRLQAFADQASVAIKNAQLYEEMQQLAVTDSLTGLYNRRYFFAFVENEIARSKRYEKELSLIMMDIDKFKQVNDKFGHQTGDKVLKMIAEKSLENLRRVDIMCRFGGEEFTILLPETPKSEAILAAERICRKIEAARLETKDGEVKVTVSIGVAGLDDSIESLNDLIGAADKALYAAKEAGRNRVHAL